MGERTPDDLQARDNAHARDSARGGLLGLACGDALGRPVDGHTAAAVRDRHGRVTEMLGGDDRPAGTTTGVTAAAIRSARGLLRDPRADATVRPSTGASAEEAADSASEEAVLLAGAVPYGLTAGADPIDRAAAAVDGLAVERGDSEEPDAATDSLAACAVLAVVVGELVAGASVDDALATARRVAVDRDAPVGVRETLAVVGDPAAATVDAGGGIDATFETALHEAVAADGPEEAVVSAVSRGGAASSLGGVAGAVAGARAGADAVPARWLNELDGADDLRDLGDRLADARIEP